MKCGFYLARSDDGWAYSMVLSGKVLQINVKPEVPGERGLPKRLVERAFVGSSGLVGDFNRWRHEEADDDLRMAVLLMPIEVLEELDREGWSLKPDDLGENFDTGNSV